MGTNGFIWIGHVLKGGGQGLNRLACPSSVGVLITLNIVIQSSMGTHFTKQVHIKFTKCTRQHHENRDRVLKPGSPLID